MRISTITMFVAFGLLAFSGAHAPAQTTAAQPVSIAVYGASGRAGSRIVREALDRGHSVTGIGRTPSNITERHERLTIAQGDVTDTASASGELMFHIFPSQAQFERWLIQERQHYHRP